MKRRFPVILLIVALLSLLLATVVSAAAPAISTLTVRNRTGDVASLALANPSGAYTYFTIPEYSTAKFQVEAERYSYWLTSNCGFEYGSVNLTNHKLMTVHCTDGGLNVDTVKPKPACSQYAWWHYPIESYEGGHWHDPEDEPWEDEGWDWDWRCADGVESEKEG
jgi:hypothetical protein